MKKMAILTLTPDALKDILQLPDDMTFIEVRIPFDRPGTMEIKVEGVGWNTVKGGHIQRANPVIVTKLGDGTLDVDWGIPE